MTKFTDEQVGAILRSYRLGLKKPEIAKLHNVSNRHISRLARLHGIPGRGDNHWPSPDTALSKETKDDILAAYATGAPRAEIAKTFNIHVSTLDRIRMEANVPTRQKKRSKLEEHIIVGKYIRGDKLICIAFEHSMSERQVRKIGKRAGIPAREMPYTRKTIKESV